MKNLKATFVLVSYLSIFFVLNNAYAGTELVCKGRQARSNHRVVTVDCSKRKEFVDSLGAAWRKLREEHIGQFENICWEAYNQAKDIPPTISFSNISDGFLMRCNMGLAYVD